MQLTRLAGMISKLHSLWLSALNAISHPGESLAEWQRTIEEIRSEFILLPSEMLSWLQPRQLRKFGVLLLVVLVALTPLAQPDGQACLFLACALIALITGAASVWLLKSFGLEELPRPLRAVARLACAVFFITAGSAVAVAQGPVPDPNVEAGTGAFASYDSGNIDSDSLSTGSLDLRIPIISYPQRGGKLKLDFMLRYWNTGLVADCPSDLDCSVVGALPYNHGFAFGPADQPDITSFIAGLGGIVCGPNWPAPSGGIGLGCTGTVDVDGANHVLWPIGQSTWQAVDGSGWRLDISPPDLQVPNRTYTFTDSQGTRYSAAFEAPNGPFLSPVVIEDSSGNQMSLAYGFTGTDTVGRVIPARQYSTNATDFTGCTGSLPMEAVDLWNAPGPNGGSYPVKLCHGTLVETNGNDASPVQSVVLPNGTNWTFEYTTDGFGDLARVTFPTGGTLSYTWTSPTPLSHDHDIIFTRGIATRTLDPHDGVTPAATWRYAYSRSNIVNNTPMTATTTVTDPAGNDSVHTFTNFGNFQAGGFYETRTDLYQGSSTSGTL
jgi:YD repeat-containing protein